MTPKEIRDAVDELMLHSENGIIDKNLIRKFATNLREHADEIEPWAVPHSPPAPPPPPVKTTLSTLPEKMCAHQFITPVVPCGWACGALEAEKRGYKCPYTASVCEDHEPLKPEPVPPPEHVLPNIWDRCTALAVANGAAEHDHGHGDVAALVLKKLQQHLNDHEVYGNDHPYFEILCRRRKETVENLLKRKDKDQETDEQAAFKIDGRSVTVTAQAYESQRLVVPVGYPRIAASILKEHGVQITSVQMQKGLLKELGVWDVVVHVGGYAATVKVWIVREWN